MTLATAIKGVEVLRCALREMRTSRNWDDYVQGLLDAYWRFTGRSVMMNAVLIEEEIKTVEHMIEGELADD